MPPCNHARRRSQARSYSTAIIPRNCKHATRPGNADNLEHMMWHHADRAGDWAAQCASPARPAARQIERRAGIRPAVIMPKPQSAPRHAVAAAMMVMLLGLSCADERKKTKR